MRLDWDEKIAGLTMMEVRHAVCRLTHDTHAASVASVIGIAPDAAEALVGELFNRGWIEDAGGGYIRTTVIGNAVAQAKKLKPISRAQADKLFVAVVTAASEVNDDERYAHSVAKLGVFGSYLGHAEELGDLDIAYELAPRWQSGDSGDCNRVCARSNAAFPPTRRLGALDLLFWPEQVVSAKLKVNSRVSLHSFQEVTEGLKVPVRMVLG